MPMQKTHKVLMNVTFNRPCTNAEAVAAVRDNVHGDFYPFVQRDLGQRMPPDKFRIRSVRRAPKNQWTA